MESPERWYPNSMRTEFRLRLSAVAGSAVARRLVERAFRLWRLPHRVDDGLIVITELVENVIRHTPAGGDLRLYLRPGTVVIEVADSSPQLPVIREADPREARGRGIRMVQAIATRWGASPVPGGKVVWAELDTAA